MTAEGGGALRASVVREQPFANPLVRRTPTHGDSDVLPNNYFLQTIRTERKRADRSRSPLSLAVFKYNGGARDRLMRLEQLIQTIYDLKRDIDIVGHLEHDSIGVLLLDTGNGGALTFLRRVIARCDDGVYVGSVFTHPDLLFSCLNAEDVASRCSRSLVFDALPRRRSFQAGAKRVMDVVLASVCLVLLAPVMMVCALLIAATSKGPVIFRQERLGRNGVPFIINKFRSMYFQADDGIHREHVTRLIGNSSHGVYSLGGPSSWTTLKEDPRVTRVGRVMRRTKLDELPQLFNVIKGDLSLVGPRPPLEYEVKQYQAWHLRRILHVRPGITGIWQVEGDDSTTFDDMVRMDVHYVENWSLFLDLRVLVKTAGIVLQRIFEPLSGTGVRRLRVPAVVRRTARIRR